MTSSSEKICTKCHALKSLIDFPRKKSAKDGLSSWCKVCFRETCKKWRSSNAEHYSAKQREYRESGVYRSSVIESGKRWQESNKEHVEAYRKGYNKNRGLSLPDSYIANKLGISVSEAPKELLEMKREQVHMKRLTKQLNEVLTETIKGEDNDIAN